MINQISQAEDAKMKQITLEMVDAFMRQRIQTFKAVLKDHPPFVEPEALESYIKFYEDELQSVNQAINELKKLQNAIESDKNATIKNEV